MFYVSCWKGYCKWIMFIWCFMVGKVSDVVLAFERLTLGVYCIYYYTYIHIYTYYILLYIIYYILYYYYITIIISYTLFLLVFLFSSSIPSHPLHTQYPFQSSLPYSSILNPSRWEYALLPYFLLLVFFFSSFIHLLPNTSQSSILYSSSHQLLTPHVLSEWMVEVCAGDKCPGCLGGYPVLMLGYLYLGLCLCFCSG